MKNNFKKLMLQDEENWNLPDFDFEKNSSPDASSPFTGKRFSFNRLYETIANHFVTKQGIESEKKITNTPTKKNLPPDIG
jgi:hypothetical protein